ncbi:MAG: hypothetical protein Q4G63_03655 [Bacteroidia bacterium]|nr:hypothetical protein [Bacteroidia bacterium]
MKKLKQTAFLLAALLIMGIIMTSCEKDELKPTLDMQPWFLAQSDGGYKVVDYGSLKKGYRAEGFYIYSDAKKTEIKNLTGLDVAIGDLLYTTKETCTITATDLTSGTLMLGNATFLYKDLSADKVTIINPEGINTVIYSAKYYNLTIKESIDVTLSIKK